MGHFDIELLLKLFSWELVTSKIGNFGNKSLENRSLKNGLLRELFISKMGYFENEPLRKWVTSLLGYFENWSLEKGHFDYRLLRNRSDRKWFTSKSVIFLMSHFSEIIFFRINLSSYPFFRSNQMFGTKFHSKIYYFFIFLLLMSFREH